MTHQDIIKSATDEELVALTIKEQDYFLGILERYRPKLFSYIRRLTNIGPEDAEDILQEVFIKTYANLNDFNSSLKFSSWIYRIAHNQVISHHRKVKARPEGYAVPVDDHLIESLVAETDIIRGVDQEILREKVKSALEKIDARYQEVLMLKFLEEKSYQEISDIIAKPLGTVASLINKAKQEFKKEFYVSK